VRWLGRVPYREAHVLQRALHDQSSDDYLLLLEHPHVFTLGVRAEASHVLVDPASVGATVERVDRGGDVTYHGPGQLVAYPVVNVPMGTGAIPAHVERVERLVIETLAELGLSTGRLPGYPGVWVGHEGPRPRKICAVGVRVSRGRSMHGLALNVDPDMCWFDRIVPCGISDEDKGVTSMRLEGVDSKMSDVVEVLVARASELFGRDGLVERQDVSSFSMSVRHSASSEPLAPGEMSKVRLRAAGVDTELGLPMSSRKPPWLRAPVQMGESYMSLRRTLKGLDLVTVCEEAGCPNIFECWAQGTATFMINGERCTRACGFCQVDTRHPLPLDPEEPARVAEAVERLRLEHAVVTAVARDDLCDGGAGAFVSVIEAIRSRCPGTSVEVLVPDCKGDEASIQAIADARPDVFNHNLETVARLQRAVRPSARYARSLAVLAQAKESGLVTKSGLMLGLGERDDEVVGALADLRSVGVDIVTLGQYLRPSVRHLPVSRWASPVEFARLGDVASRMGFVHVQASPLTRSSYHAKQAVGAVNATDGHDGCSRPSALAEAGSLRP
jgi:lipoic acid synthetase